MDFSALQNTSITKKMGTALSWRGILLTMLGFVILMAAFAMPAFFKSITPFLIVEAILTAALGVLIASGVRYLNNKDYRSPEMVAAYDAVAAANGWQRLDSSAIPLNTFRAKASRFGILQGNLHGCTCSFYELSYEEDKGVIIDSAVWEVVTPWQLPECTLYPTYSQVLSAGKKVSLEGDFNQYVTVTTRQANESEIFELLAPDVMQAILNTWPGLVMIANERSIKQPLRNFKLVLQGSKVTLYYELPSTRAYQENIESMYLFVDSFIRQLVENNRLAGR